MQMPIAAAEFDFAKKADKFFVMKFDVEIPALNGIARIEIRSVRDGEGWSSYLGFVSDRTLPDTCLMLGQSGVPHRFSGQTEQEAAERAKAFLKNNYRVVRMVW